jgi:hypothetical protein
MTHKQKRIFFNWLQRRGALKAYKRARYQQKTVPPFESYEKMSINTSIGWAFHWESTSEGFDFWKNLDREWYYFLRSLKHE